MRKGELLSLCLCDLDFDRGVIHIRDGKGHKDRYVPFSANMRKVMLAYLKAYRPVEYVFEREKRKPMEKPGHRECWHPALKGPASSNM